ncbi:MAG TPA: Tex family protein [Pirellulales bacterium]|jgi:uncharacterized protein
MVATLSLDLSQIAQPLGLPLARVQAVVDLLDSGNTVPFITRYRKDQTGGMDEEQIRAVQESAQRLRQLADRKQTILRSIEAQGKATPELRALVEAADTMKRLEDLYLPYKPKKQTLATIARERGLEPLAEEILRADPACHDLDARAAEFVNPDRKLQNIGDVLLGVGHILAETFSERADLRGRLRAILEQTGRLVSAQADADAKEAAAEGQAAQAAAAPEAPALVPPVSECTALDTTSSESTAPEATAIEDTGPVSAALESAAPSAGDSAQGSPVEAADMLDAASAAKGEGMPPASTPAPAAPTAVAKKSNKDRKEKKDKKDKKDAKGDRKAFQDFFDFSEALGKVPPHRVLAINRGERAKILKIKVETDLEAMYQVIEELIVGTDRPHMDFLRGCGRDALHRLILPSLEREVRRELTDRAEAHAVDVFARNLRKLLLQPQVRDCRVLALDPGFKSGCKWAALDEFGNLLDQGVVHLIGSEERRAAAKAKVIETIREHKLTVIAIGNGTACRETEQWVSEMIAGELAADNVSYVIVNEAGASVYSTSQIGREEFPTYDATLRGAISIGRRLQDPLSELVKIDPANIGVGMYQHDVKAKHLRESLDAVVESCVNFVGVDLNTASAALLRYVSGLNQLTAHRLVSQRMAQGPFTSRAQLRSVLGFGEAAFVQAAGFLKIAGGDNPLDATWIHPESYPAAEQLLGRLGFQTADLADKAKAPELAERLATTDRNELASAVQVGELTLADLVTQLARPGRDPRESLPKPIFKRGILKLDDLAPGMDLMGTVLNVVDFGAFVDIGLKDSGLVHISQLAAKYIQDPHDVISVGDIVTVWVMAIDKERRRVSLTMIDPASRQKNEERRPPRQDRRGDGRGSQNRPAAATAGAVGAPAGGGGRPNRGPGQGGQGQRGGQGQGPGRGQGRRPDRRDSRTDAPAAQQPPPPRPKPKPSRPAVPLTKKMIEGREPLRTFGDLQQFFQLKKPEDGAQEPPKK